MMRRSIIILPLIFFSAFAQRWIDQIYPEPIFYLSPHDEPQLTYYELVNRFDSVTISWIIGEFRLLVDSATVRILPLHYATIPDTGIAGIDGRGADTVLAAVMRTDTFTIPTNGTLFFFRAIERSVPHSMLAFDTLSPTFSHWTDRYWATPTGWITDTTMVKIELRRASDDALLMVLDSAGVFPNTQSLIPVRFGTEPDQMSHFRTLPNSMGGTTAYIRIIPHRYGPTPYGLRLFQFWSWCSLSTLREYDSTAVVNGYGAQRWHGADYDSLYHAYYEQLRAFLDSGITATGELPPHTAFLIDSALYNDYQTRYSTYSMQWDPAFPIIITDTIWNEDQQQSVLTVRPNRRVLRSQQLQNVIIIPRNYKQSAVFYIEFTATQPLPSLQVEIFDAQGRLLATQQRDHLPAGFNKLFVRIPQPISAGTYVLSFRIPGNTTPLYTTVIRHY